MEEAHEHANKLGKQGGKNPRKIPKFSINHERFSRTIEKYLNNAPAQLMTNLGHYLEVILARTYREVQLHREAWPTAHDTKYGPRILHFSAFHYNINT